jgi:hypothetical protein
MTERNPFEKKPAETGQVPGRGPLRCEEWEVLLTEALDGLLPAAERATFDTHGAECAVCAQLLSQAKQGQEWLSFLEDEPDVPTDLVERIVGKTSGVVAGGPLAVAGVGPIPAPVHVLGLPVRRSMWDTRMMMTVAMAFFSIALTLNLAGVRLTHLRLSDLTPASLEMNLTQQFWGAEKSIVRYYENLRLVYEVESKMRDLRRAEEMQQQKPQQEQQQEQPVPANPSGNGHKNGGKLVPAIPKEGALWGRPEVASVEGSERNLSEVKQVIRKTEEEGANFEAFCDGDQAERSLA